MKYQHNDGGRKAAGFEGTTGDCAARAVAIASGMPYAKVYDIINEIGKRERKGSRKRGTSNARTGVYKFTMKAIMEKIGATWTPTMSIGSGCTVHLKDGELPMGRIVVNVSKHFAAVIDGVLHDNHDCSRGGTRCVYGYWTMPELYDEGRDPAKGGAK